ncbi:peptidoglycan DD-metalloendopeptidase family protein [Candidatus Kaiserbacteria bacterium]|nr:peptidoglycan DD-metalloendopeptidase family protein [Candidatus Kaiserbacteria bacterium]
MLKTVRINTAGILSVALIALPFFSTPLLPMYAASEVEQLKSQIADRNNRLKEIEAEIAKFQVALQTTGNEKSTLQSAINQLELERKKLQADISYTQNKIGATDLEISKLTIEITDTERTIEQNEAAIAETLRRLDEADTTSLIEALLSHTNLAAFWTSIEELEQVREVMGDNVRTLTEERELLEQQHKENTDRRSELVDLKAQYTDQNTVLGQTRAEKDTLLEKTQQKEEIYQQLLSEREAEKEKFEKELRDLEAQLQFILDPDSIPRSGTIVFDWPLDTVRITQYFGDTAFSRTAAYRGNGHNGIDLGVSRGTPVKAALAGKVVAINTTVASMCQYGKWVLIQHANGLSTLYAHLSLVSVNAGDTVSTGETIGYSGDTGYATGPHLHFTVYASQAVEFTQYTCNSGVTLTIPVSAFTGYLNPMDYLPIP